MRIVFLGTSHGIPQPDKKCSCTLVENAGRIYLVDMGTMVMEALVSRGIPADYTGVCRQYGVKQLCLNHCSPKKLPELADLKEVLAPMPVTAVFDGMEMTL